MTNMINRITVEYVIGSPTLYRLGVNLGDVQFGIAVLARFDENEVLLFRSLSSNLFVWKKLFKSLKYSENLYF